MPLIVGLFWLCIRSLLTLRSRCRDLTGLHSLRILNLSHNNGLSEFASELTKLRFPFDEMRPATLFARKMSQKQLRRQQIQLLLNGGERTSYRIRERLPADAAGGSRPPGAGDRHGWALVRFVVFGEQDHDVHRHVRTSAVSSSSSSSDAEEDDEDKSGGGASMLIEQGRELEQARKGLVKRMRNRYVSNSRSLLHLY